MDLIGNFSDHPTNNRVTVFKFYRPDQAEYFKRSLQEADIWFEEDKEEEEGSYKHLFAIKNRDLNVVRRLNYTAIGKYRDPFIVNKYFRYFVIIISIIVMTIAIIGYLKS